jgi:hypothetical protein
VKRPIVPGIDPRARVADGIRSVDETDASPVDEHALPHWDSLTGSS